MTPEKLTIRVLGIPAPQGSKRHVGGGRMVEMSKKLPAWRKAVEQEIANTVGEDFPTFAPPVTVNAEFILPRPKSSKYDGPYGPPDVDKLQRAIGDCLQRAGLIEDDSHITAWVRPRKRWAHHGEQPGATITIHAGDNT